MVYFYKKRQKIPFQNERIEMDFILSANESTLPQTIEMSNSGMPPAATTSVKTSNIYACQEEDKTMVKISNTNEIPYQPVIAYNLRTKPKKK